MKTSRFLTQKLKVAILLFSVMVLVVLLSLVVDNRTRQMDKAVTTVYEDRLQPALTIVSLSENLHARRMLLDNHLNGRSRLPSVVLKARLAEYDAINDELVTGFEQTVLTRNETAVLAEFKEHLATNVRMERMVLRRAAGEGSGAAVALYNRNAPKIFRQSIQDLHILAQIQSETGREVVRGSHRDAAGVFVITYLLMAAALVIGIFVQGLVHNARFLETDPTKFNLN